MPKKKKQIKNFKSPIIYPLGVGIGSDNENKTIFLEFIENFDDSKDDEIININAAYAIPLKKAKFMVKQIESLIKEIEKNEK